MAYLREFNTDLKIHKRQFLGFACMVLEVQIQLAATGRAAETRYRRFHRLGPDRSIARQVSKVQAHGGDAPTINPCGGEEHGFERRGTSVQNGTNNSHSYLSSHLNHPATPYKHVHVQSARPERQRYANNQSSTVSGREARGRQAHHCNARLLLTKTIVQILQMRP